MALAAQLNLVFFLVVGLRIAATMPADLDAGWVFRFLATPARERHVAGTRSAIFFLAVLPLLVVLAPMHVWLWGGYTATVHFAFGVVLGPRAARDRVHRLRPDAVRVQLHAGTRDAQPALRPLPDRLLPLRLCHAGDRAAPDRAHGALLRLARAVRDRRRPFPQLAVGALPARSDCRSSTMPVEMQQLGLWDTVHRGERVTDGDAGDGPAGALFQSVGREPAPRVAVPGRAWAWPVSQMWLDVATPSGGCG